MSTTICFHSACEEFLPIWNVLSKEMSSLGHLVRQRFHLCRAAFAVDWTLLFFTRCCPCITQSSPTQICHRSSQFHFHSANSHFHLGWLERYSISGFVTDHHSPIVSARFIIVFCIQIESTLSWFFIHDTLYLRCWWGMYVCARENKGNYLIPPQCHKTAHLFIFICSAVQRCHQKLFGFHPIENIT